MDTAPTHLVIAVTPSDTGAPFTSAYGPFTRDDAYDFAVEFDRRHADRPGYSSSVTVAIASPSYLIGASAAELWRAGEDWSERTVRAELRAHDLRTERIAASR